MKTDPVKREARKRLVEIGGRTAADLGLGRIIGRILVYLYLEESERSLDDIAAALGLSKAAVSIGARQLEALGLLMRSWKDGDRRAYYRTADNIATALRQGVFRLVSQRISSVATELDEVHERLSSAVATPGVDSETRFLYQRVQRAKVLRDRAEQILNNPLLKMLLPS